MSKTKDTQQFSPPFNCNNTIRPSTYTPGYHIHKSEHNHTDTTIPNQIQIHTAIAYPHKTLTQHNHPSRQLLPPFKQYRPRPHHLFPSLFSRLYCLTSYSTTHTLEAPLIHSHHRLFFLTPPCTPATLKIQKDYKDIYILLYNS